MIATTYTDFRALFGAGGPTALDGFPEWPLIYVINFGPGFPPPLSGVQFSFPVTIDADPGAEDSTPGVDDWDWYLQMPTERTPAANRLVLTRDDVNPPAVTNSSRVLLSLTAVGAAINTQQTPAALEMLFRDVHLFCRQRVGGDVTMTAQIRAYDLYRAVFAAETYS